MDDRFGLPLTTHSTVAAERWVEGLDILLENNYAPEEKFQQALEADTGFALAHACLAYTSMMRGQAVEARQSGARAQALAQGVSPRESRPIEAIARWTVGKGPEALALTREHLAEFPRDVFMLRLAQRLYTLGCIGSGVPDFPDHLFQLVQSLEPDNGDEWAFLGVNAFAHHEVGRFDQALSLAERALALRPTSAVAAHSASHALFETAEYATGTDFLSAWLLSFDRRAPYRVHLSWHLALFELATGHYQRAFDLYESEIRPAVVARRSTTLNDSASLLWRWHMYADSPPPFPWDEVRDLATPAAEAAGPAFRDAHAALALAGSGDQTTMEQFLNRLSQAAEAGDRLISQVTLPLARGIEAFASGDYVEAVARLEPVFPQLARIGGSHAQREVFEDTLLEAYLRAEAFDKAETMLRTRLQRRESTRDTYAPQIGDLLGL